MGAAVAPHWGAWIEISPDWVRHSHPSPSHPTGVRGLKLDSLNGVAYVDGRTPLGCVD